jgi:hypothetical protein
MAAPVCHVSKDQVISQPAPKTQPSIPLATDLASALAAIGALKKIVENLTQPQPQNNTGGNGFKTTNNPPPNGTWQQQSRTTEKVKITNPSDPSQFVEIERINALTMVDTTTGNTWKWNR